jgi:DNA-binding PadR family transcriptional regulator
MRGRGRGRGRGRYRRVARMLEPALLLLLHHGPAHGYTLMERLEEFGLEGLNPSVVYRVLRDMESRGWVSSTWDEETTQGPPRRVYNLAALGDEVLGWSVQDLRAARAMIDHLLGAYSQHMEEGEGEYHN